jgi:hypothetical protein
VASAKQQHEIRFAGRIADRHGGQHLVVALDGGPQKLRENRMPLGHASDLGPAQRALSTRNALAGT